MPNAGWGELRNELDRWADSGSCATLWCRDDDAFEVTPALERLVSMSSSRGVPVGLAVIPCAAQRSLAASLRACHSVTVLVHGYAHVNHAPASEKRAEFGADRPLDVMKAEARRARERIEELFEGQSLPLFVPPWNRISGALVAELASIGLAGLSTYLCRARASPAPGVRQVNCHVDIIDWKGQRGFIGDSEALRLLNTHLMARRLDTVDRDEATGVLTHHKFHDAGCWAFLEQLWLTTVNHPAVRWLDASEAMWPH